MTDLNSLDLLLARARSGLAPSDVQLEQLEARIFDVPAPDVASPAAGRWAAFQATGGAGLLAAALLITGGFIAGYFARPLAAQSVASPAATSSTANVPAPAAIMRSDAPATAQPAPAAPSSEPAEAEPSSSRSKRLGKASAERRPAAQSSLDVSAELALLERIDRALRNSDAPLALALLDQLEHSHPRTQLEEERRAARLMAACLGGSAGAAVAASNFLGAQPASVYASRLRAVCDVE